MSAGLDSLLEALQAAGLWVTPLQAQQVEVVVARLSEAELAQPGLLEGVLASVLLKDADPQRRALLRQVLGAQGQPRQRLLPDEEPGRLPVTGAAPPPRPGGLWGRLRGFGAGLTRPRPGARLRRMWRQGRQLWRLRRLRMGVLLLVGVAGVIAGALLLRHLVKQGPEPTPPPAPADMAAPPPTADGGVLEPGLAQTFVADEPEFVVQPAALSPQVRQGLAWTAAGGLLLGVLLVLRRRGLRPPPVAKMPAPGGPERLLPGDAAAGERILLAPRQEEALVWGVGRFLSGEPTEHLDIPATVGATADAAGCFTPQHLLARYQREVWLWQDRSTATAAYGPLVARLSDEIAAALRRSGLPVEQASYLGLPDRLHGAHGPLYPGDLEDRRDGASVLLLTDGRELVRRMSRERSRPAVRGLLRQLSAWPRLALVDFSGDAHGLQGSVAALGLTVLLPAEAAAWLGCEEGLARAGAAGAAEEPAGAPTEEDLATQSWAAALSVAPFPISEGSALRLWRRLREELGLAGSPYGLAGLRARYAGAAGRLGFKPAERARLMRSLVAGLPAEQEGAAAAHAGAATAHAGAALAAELKRRMEGTLLGVALLHFEAEVRAALREPAEAVHFAGSQAELRLRLWQALLRLVRDPAGALPELQALHGPEGVPGPLRQELRQELARLLPQDAALPKDWQERGLLLLPWRLLALRPMDRVQLLRLGLGEQAGLKPTQALRPPARRLAAAGLAAGVAAGALGMAAVKWQQQGLRLYGAPQGAWLGRWEGGLASETQRTPLLGSGTFWMAGTARTAVAKLAAEKQLQEVQWHRKVLPCQVALSDGAVWRCGALAEPKRPALADWPQQRVAWLAFESKEPAAQRLAQALLDSGSADVVLLGSATSLGIQSWLRVATSAGLQLPTPRREFLLLGGTGSVMQGVSAAELDKLAAALRFDGVKPIEEVWPQAQRGTGLRLAGLGRGGCPYREYKDERGQVWVYVCGGEFTMGSAEDDADAYKYEKPAHRVRVEDFWMHKYEVSVEQFRPFAQRRKIDNWQASDRPDDRPVAYVNWEEARAFCHESGGRLPMEAEWEYAARGAEGRKYPWGSTPPDKTLAAFNRDYSKDHPDAVTSHEEGRGPFGTLNQAGNVWEWVQDCWEEDYKRRQRSDKLATLVIVNDNDTCPVGADRVIRGASFDRGPGSLRSAYRLWFGAQGRVLNLGFRCVRGSRLQH